MKKITAEQYTIFLLLIMIAALPPFIYTITGAQTLSIGMMLCSIAVIFTCRNKVTRIFSPNKKMLYIALVILIYMLLQHLTTGVWNVKSYLSIPIIIIMLIAGYLAALTLLKTNQEALKKAVYKVYYTCCAIVSFNIMTQYSLGEKLGYTHSKSIFPFLEPSHFATFFGIFFLLFFVSNTKKSSRLISLIFTLSISALIPNTTMLTYAGIALLVFIFSSNQSKIFLSSPIAAITFIIVFNIIITDSYFTDRLNFSIDNTNTSALVYMQGLDDTKNSLLLTEGLGLGFQMLGTQPASIYSQAIARSMGSSSSELNRSDGGFFAAKIISEFGFLGIIFIVALLFYVAKSGNNIKKILSKKNSTPYNFTLLASYTVIISFVVEVFVRGAGYFTPGFFIFIVSAFFITISKRSTN